MSTPGTALITGASAGIGRELAKVFAAHGHDVVLVARNRKRLAELATQLRADHGVEATVISCDLGRPGAASSLFRLVARRKLEIEILVNNAGVMFNGDFGELALADHLSVIQVNVVALTSLAHLFLEPMIHRGHGRLLTVSSMAGLQPLPRLGVYAATKAYAIHLTEAISEELVGTGVTATVLCPGFTQTDILAQAPDVSRLPAFAIGKAEQVAIDGYRACMNATPLYISGFANQWASQAIRYQPRWLSRTIAGAFARRNRRKA